MAEVRLAEVYVPVPFNHAVDEAAIELNAFLASGVMAEDSVLSGMASVGGSTGEVPNYDALGTDEPNYDSDDPASTSTPLDNDHTKQNYRIHKLNQSWSTMDLARDLALADPLAAITRQVGKYWATQIEKRVIQTALGVLADNVANDSSDMLYSVALDTASTILDAEKMSADAVIQAAQTMGDHKKALSVIAMHSVPHAHLQSLNLISYIPNSRGEIEFGTYLGYRVVVDDSLPAVMGSNRITYTSILFSAGAFGHGSNASMVPSEIDRAPAAGDGGGQDIIYSRQGGIIHPWGFDNTGTPAAGTTHTLAELAVATCWNRVHNRKNIGIAFLETN